MAEGGPVQRSESSTSTRTETLNQSAEPAPRSPAVVLKLHKPKNDKKVQWDETTVDNEHMNKKKSKCCCIYEKPRLFGESSSEDEDDDGCSPHCRGHKKKLPHDHHDHDHHHHAATGECSGHAPNTS